MVHDVFRRVRAGGRPIDVLDFQPHPGAPLGDVPVVKIEEIARASGVNFVEVVDAFDLAGLIDVVGKAIRYEGPSLVVARRLCNILDARDKRKTGEKVVPYEVDAEKCLAGSPAYCQATCPLHIDVRGYVGLPLVRGAMLAAQDVFEAWEADNGGGD